MPFGVTLLSCDMNRERIVTVKSHSDIGHYQNCSKLSASTDPCDVPAELG